MKLDMIFVSWLLRLYRERQAEPFASAPSTSLLVPLNSFVAVTTYLENVVTRNPPPDI